MRSPIPAHELAPKASGLRDSRALPRVLFIVGPTASGKTGLGIALAKKFHGEVINADARQIYRNFNIGTGKPSLGRRGLFEGRRTFMVENVPHHLMDFLPPTKVCTVAEWQRKALRAVKSITARGHLPIVVGGTGLYIQALLDNYRIPSVPPNPSYRAAMELKSLEELVTILSHMDPEAVKVVDLKNRRRVLRALEVVTFTGKSFLAQRSRTRPVVDPLVLGVFRTKEELQARIEDAVEKMIGRGWVEEIRTLYKMGIVWDAPAMTSIGYRELSAYVRGECSREEAILKTKRATRQYAKRQMTWFKRDTRTHWVKEQKEAERLLKQWLKGR